MYTSGLAMKGPFRPQGTIFSTDSWPAGKRQSGARLCGTVPTKCPLKLYMRLVRPKILLPDLNDQRVLSNNERCRSSAGYWSMTNL